MPVKDQRSDSNSNAGGQRYHDVPTHLSRCVRNVDRLKSFFAVAMPEVISYCELGVGPFGSLIAVLAGTHGESTIALTRIPRRLKSKGCAEQLGGTWHGDSSAATPSCGGTT